MWEWKIALDEFYCKDAVWRTAVMSRRLLINLDFLKEKEGVTTTFTDPVFLVSFDVFWCPQLVNHLHIAKPMFRKKVYSCLKASVLHGEYGSPLWVPYRSVFSILIKYHLCYLYAWEIIFIQEYGLWPLSL